MGVEESVSEVWKAIPGFEGAFEASTLGRLRSLDRIVSHNKGGTRKWKGGPNMIFLVYFVILALAVGLIWKPTFPAAPFCGAVLILSVLLIATGHC